MSRTVYIHKSFRRWVSNIQWHMQSRLPLFTVCEICESVNPHWICEDDDIQIMRSDCNLSTVLWQSSGGHMGVCFQFHPQCQAAGWDRTVFMNSGREPAVKQSDRLGSNPLQLSFLLKWLPSLPILMRESFCLCQCRDRYIISLFPHLHTPFPPLPSLISHIVSVDVKHHVYLWMAVAFCLTGWNSTLTGLWWISHQGTLWILAVCLFSSVRSFILGLSFACWSFSTVLWSVMALSLSIW